MKSGARSSVSFKADALQLPAVSRTGAAGGQTSSTIRQALTVAALILSPHVAAKDFPVAGGYGFDWLKPKAAKCLPISDAEAKKFRKCEFFAAGDAFGLASTYHMCTAPGRSEYFVYESRAKCVEALETMKANGP